MIAISLAPNFETSDALGAVRLLFSPWQWRVGGSNQILLEKMRCIFGDKKIFIINSARYGLFLLLESLNLSDGSEVLMQAFTCVSVPGPALWNKLRPVYVDILADELTMDPIDLKKKISDKSRVLIIQHTFGMPAHMDELLEIAREHNLIVIEDCAHVIGGAYHNQLLGTIGDAAIFSFGRDKAISSVFGGAIIVNSKEKFKGLKRRVKELPQSGIAWTVQQLMHPILFVFLIKPLYFFFQIGKLKLVAAQRLRIIAKAIARREKKGGRPQFACAKMPNALAALAVNQFERLEKFNRRRQAITKIYDKNFAGLALLLPKINENTNTFLLRYTILVDDPKQMRLAARKKKILLGDWYEVIAPKDADLIAVGYVAGSCKTAEVVAQKAINLPTYYKMTDKQAFEVADFIKNNMAVPPRVKQKEGVW